MRVVVQLIFGAMALRFAWLAWSGYQEGFRRPRRGRRRTELERVLDPDAARQVAWAQLLGSLVALAAALGGLYVFSTLPS